MDLKVILEASEDEKQQNEKDLSKALQEAYKKLRTESPHVLTYIVIQQN